MSDFKVVWGGAGFEIARTFNFLASSPTWQSVNISSGLVIKDITFNWHSEYIKSGYSSGSLGMYVVTQGVTDGVKIYYTSDIRASTVSWTALATLQTGTPTADLVSARIAMSKTYPGFGIAAWKDNTGTLVSRTTDGINWSAPTRVGVATTDGASIGDPIGLEIDGLNQLVSAPDSTGNYYLYLATTSTGSFAKVANSPYSTKPFPIVVADEGGAAYIRTPTLLTSDVTVTFDEGGYNNYTIYATQNHSLGGGKIGNGVTISGTSTNYSDFQYLRVCLSVNAPIPRGASVSWDWKFSWTGTPGASTRISTGYEVRSDETCADTPGHSPNGDIYYLNQHSGFNNTWQIANYSFVPGTNSQAIMVDLEYEHLTSGSIDWTITIDNVQLHVPTLPAPKFYRIDNYAGTPTWDDITPAGDYQPFHPYGVCVDCANPKQIAIVGRTLSAQYKLLSSANQGNVWTDINTNTYNGLKFYAETLTVFGNNVLSYSTDYGQAFQNKIGNLGSIFPSGVVINGAIDPVIEVRLPCNHNGPCSCPVNYTSDGCETTTAPASLRTGDKYEEVTDLTINTPAGMLTFTRAYRLSKHSDPNFQFMGMGWTHNHRITLTENTSVTPNTIVIGFGNAGDTHFTKVTGVNRYDGDAGSASQIAVNSSIDYSPSNPTTPARYVLTTADKSLFLFDANRRLRRRQWPNGEYWEYVYPTGTSMLVSEVVDEGYNLDGGNPPLRRKLIFTYSSDRLTRVTDHTGCYVEFTYAANKIVGGGGSIVNGTDIVLKKVRDVRGQEWTYDYYGQQSGQTDTNQLNYLTKYQSPLVNTTGDGTSTVTITLKELNYIVSSGSVTDMTQKLGFVGTADPSVQIDIAFRAGSEHLTSETIDGKTTQHHFLGAIYEGTELPGANGQYARRLLDFGYRPKKLFDANGNSTALEWEENGRRLSAVTNSLYPNNPTQFEYNTDDTLKHSVDPEGRRTAYSYNGTTQFRLPDTIVVRETDSDTAPILRKQEFTYDSKGRVLTEKTINLVTNNPSQQTTRTYHNSGIGNGLLHTVVQKDFSTVNPNDITTTYTYDSAGRVTKTQQSSNFGNCEISYTVYDAAGNVVATICNYDAGGSADPTTAAQAVALYNPAYPDKNRVTTHEYDAMGRRIKTTVNAGASFSQTSLTFHDALNRVVRTITNYIPQGGSPEAPGLWYWGGSQWKQASGVDISDGVNNDQNIITDTIYNAWGLVESQRDTLGNLTRFVYDDAGRVIRTIVNYVAQGSSDPQNWAWNNNQWEYSSGNAVSHGTNNDQNVVMEQQYDAAGNGVMTRDTLGNRHFTAYDALNRPVQTVRSAKTAARIDLNPGDGGYSAANDPRVLSVINPTTFALTGYTPEDNPDLDGIEQTVYDEMGRVTITRRLIDKLIETTPHYEWLETRYLYDNLGRQWRTIVNYAPQGTTDPKNWIWNSSAFQWQDGAGNQLNFGSNNDQNLISDTVYDANGRVQYTRDTMGIRNWLVYDGLGRQVKTIANCTYPGSGTAPDSDTYKGDLNDPAEDIITQTYFDSDGRVQRVKSVLRTNTGGTDLEWRWTLYGYDDVGRQVRVIQNASNHSYNFTTDPDLSAYTPVTDSDKDIITDTTYDAQGRVLQTTDTRGNITRFVYDRLNRRVKTISNYLVQGSTDPKDWIWDVNQWEDGAGNAISFGGDKDQNRITTTVYDRAGRVLSSRDSGGMETQYTYDLLNRRLKTIVNYVDGVYSSGQPDRDLISTTAYNRAGQVTATTDPRSTQTSFTYDRMGRRLTVTQAAGTGLATTSYTCYNKLGWVLRTIQNWVDNGTSPDAKATGGWWSFAPTTHGTDNDQNLITRFLYDLSGRRVRQYDPLDNRTDWFHYRNGQIRTLIQKEVEVNGLATDVSTIYRYDDLGRRTRVVQNYAAQGSSQPINWVWDASNNPPRWEDGAGNAIVHTQTVNGENIPDSQNIIVIVTYDKAGRVVKLQDPRGNLTQYAYDLLDRRTSLKNQMDIEWLTAYTDLANGKTTTTMTYPGITGAANYQVERTLDRLGRPSTLKYLGDTGSTPSLRYSYYGLQGTLSTLLEYSTPALNASDQVRKTQYGYDQIRQPVSIAFYGDETDTTGESVGYEYDAGGLRTKLKMPDNLNITYVYNAKGELTSLTDWDSQQTTMGYDKVGRHINTVRPGSLRSDYAHDAAGRLKQLKHSQSTNTLGYFDYTVDRRGNRTLATECIPHQGTGTSTNTIAATDKGILASPPGTWTVVGGYLRTDIETTGASLKMLFFGQSATLKLGKGNDAGKCDIYLNGTLVQTFDGYPAGTDASISLTPSPAGEGPHLVEIRPLGQKTAASSDYFVRFKEVSFTARTHTLHTIEYTYDGISRLKEARYNPGVNTTAIDADLLRRYRCLFDLGGNRTQEIATVGVTTTTTDYEYTAANQIYRRRLNAGAWTNFSYDNNGNLTSDGTNTYSWDRANHLLSVGSTSYKYDGYGNRFEQNVSGTITKYLLDLQPGLPVVVTETVGANVNRLVHALRGLHAQKDPSNNWEWMVQDGLGSVRGVVDNTIGVLESRNYDPYGNGFNPTGTSQTDYGFTGEPTDSNGLLYLRARYYNPATSVFTSLDPFEGMASRPMSLNGYSWVEGNVPNRTDPLGLCPSDPWWNDFPGQRCIWLANELHQLYGIPLEVLMQKDILELEGIYALGNLNNTFNESEWSSWVRGHPVEALIAGVAAPLVLAGVVAVAGSGIVIAAGTWAAGYLAYNYGPLQGIGWDFVGSIAGWKNVRWAIDTARCTGNPVHLGGAVINAMLGINLFQAVGRGIVNHVKDIGVRGNLAALQQSANQMVEQTGRVFESGVRLVENPQLIGQGFRNLGSNIIELRSLNIGTVTHEITHFFQEFAPLRGGSLGQAETSVVRILQQTSAASSSTGWGTLLPTYWLNPVELHAAAAGGNIFLPAFAGAGTQGISVSGNGREINIPGVFEAVEILGEVALYGETDWQFVTQQ